MLNWLVFLVLVCFLYLGNWLINNFIRAKDVKSLEIDRAVKVMKNVKMKSLEQQKQYLDMMDMQKNLYGSTSGKFIFIILMFICYAILLSYVPDSWILVYAILFCLVAPGIYAIKSIPEYRKYNYLSMLLMFIFFIGFMLIQYYNKLTIFGVQMRILYLLPFFFLINILTRVIRKSYLKYKLGVDKNGKI